MRSITYYMDEPQKVSAGQSKAVDPLPSGEPSRGGADPARRMQSKASDAGHELRRASEKAADKTSAAAREAGERVKEQAEQAGAQIKNRGEKFLKQQKERVASEIQTYSAAAQRAAERLESESDTNLSRYVSSAAKQLDRLGSRIQQRDLAELVEDVENMARRRPEVFFGGMFVAGLVAARFLKASKQRREPNRFRQSTPRRPRPSYGRSTGAGGRSHVAGSDFTVSTEPSVATGGAVAGTSPGSVGGETRTDENKGGTI